MKREPIATAAAARARPDGRADDIIRARTIETLGAWPHALQRPRAAR